MRLLLTLLFAVFTLISYSQNFSDVKPVDLVQSQKTSDSFESVDPFTLAVQKKSQVTELNGLTSEFDILNVSKSQLNQLLSGAPTSMTLNVPTETKGLIELELVQVDIFTPDFEVTLGSTDLPTKYERGAYYRGVIKGNNNSVVAVSVFNDEIRGLIADEDGNLVLGKLQGDNWNGEHIIYKDQEIIKEIGFDCAMPDDGISYKRKDLEFDESSRSPGDCVRLYIEVDKDIHDNKGGVAGATNFITGLMNEVITLYANESLTAVVSEIKVWDVTSPYSSNSSDGMLSDFQNNTGSFNGDLAELFSYQASGGIAAGFSGICNSNPDNSKCFSSIDNSYSIVPTYSWSVMVATHELGHLWGSRHTHACVWNGNNTAIDGCAGGTEGSCSVPGYPSQGGTLMSYCHLQSVGINFNEGFGPQPGNVIRNSVNNASCTSACGPPTCTDGIQNGNETGVDCGGPDCPACPTCSDGIQNGDETGVDCGGSSCAPCPCLGQNVTLTIVLDNYPEETSWSITSTGGGTTYASGGTYGSEPDGSTVIEITCLNDGCYDFNIFDSYGDGICCGYGNGSYVLEDGSGGTLASGGNFGSSETTNFCLSSSGPTCTDGIQNGNETGVDCGGPDCPACPTCSDGIQNGNETGVDCGGPDCPACPTCNDGIQNGNETGVDCGGPDCPACPTCSDGIQNGNETGVDCGGPDCPACPPGGCTPGSSNYTFEPGWQGWSDGGSDCARVNSSRSWEGSYSIRIRDNSGTASSTTSPAYDLSEYSSVDVEFYFYPNSMENGEDFWLRYNDGSGWQTVGVWSSGTSFSNNSFYTSTVTLDGGTYNLSSNGQFRFQCDASSNADRVYIDLVTISGNCGTGLSEGGPMVVTEKIKTPESYLSLDQPDAIEDEFEVNIYPNPANDELTVELAPEEVVHSMRIFAVSGAEMKAATVIDNFETIDVSRLVPGIYFISIETENGVINKKFIKK